MSSTIKIAIAESHEIFREGVLRQLSKNDDIELTGEASDGYGTLKLCRQTNPDVLFMDLGLMRPSGRETLSRLKRTNPDMRIVVITSDIDQDDMQSVANEGISGLIPKQAGGLEFAQALTSAMSGFACMHTRYLDEVING